ncbi:sn-glycerol-3-phosphate ABC transporter ATP-binding protein UgpC (plasmid) [Cereibacter sphaeroides]|uniref:ABC transporter ATP-binding protein n=1 Tax=Cereibacter sphaeroides TaxID=1063 RepID=UPI000F53A318|nr:sn-glycerol-3-phosphate ABC transporter ATP-binding protein UgpC [Cereibacter sphaeroides]AZB57930.1 sn-glycerol-3-phosphate ABC transporter ATP-binding protein UgpC [Cereibacter sphaeroides]AZB61975.1 sn-glycerol-3-phosphate ABC transporter ATP-binding protein UgpC [Cereibacter sphaeroides]
MSTVHVRNVKKSYSDLTVIEDLSFDIHDGEFMVFVGPSGCGKSTLLRMIAGLESFQGGEVAIGARVVNGVPARDRNIAMVFQDYALYPHMTIRDNMSFGLKMRKTPKAEIERRVAAAAEILQIGHLLDRKPRALSGGQRQRVAMGRAIVREPDVFLFDEPLSNLDAKLRVEVRTEIKRLHARLGATMIYVTHDQVEAMTMADRIVVLKGGAVEQIGTPQELYREPRTRFVAGFIGSPGMNFAPARIEGDVATLVTGDRVAVRRVTPGTGAVQGEIGIRPEHVQLADPHGPGVETLVDVVEPLGADTLVAVRLGEAQLMVRLPGEIIPAEGDRLRLSFTPGATMAFDAQGLRI